MKIIDLNDWPLKIDLLLILLFSTILNKFPVQSQSFWFLFIVEIILIYTAISTSQFFAEADYESKKKSRKKAPAKGYKRFIIVNTIIFILFLAITGFFSKYYFDTFLFWLNMLSLLFLLANLPGQAQNPIWRKYDIL